MLHTCYAEGIDGRVSRSEIYTMKIVVWEGPNYPIFEVESH